MIDSFEIRFQSCRKLLTFVVVVLIVRDGHVFLVEGTIIFFFRPFIIFRLSFLFSKKRQSEIYNSLFHPSDQELWMEIDSLWFVFLRSTKQDLDFVFSQKKCHGRCVDDFSLVWGGSVWVGRRFKAQKKATKGPRFAFYSHFFFFCLRVSNGTVSLGFAFFSPL